MTVYGLSTVLAVILPTPEVIRTLLLLLLLLLIVVLKVVRGGRAVGDGGEDNDDDIERHLVMHAMPIRPMVNGMLK